MRPISLFVIVITLTLWTACDNTTVDNAANFEFETIDKEKNTFGLTGTIHYRLKNRLEKKLSRKYGRQQYKDSLLVPVIASVSKEIVSAYSAGEVYSYKRDEVVQKIDEQTKVKFAEYDIEVQSVSVWSVRLPDTLLRRFETEYVTQFESAMNNCSKETKGVITKIYDNVAYYEFIAENKKFERILSPENIRNKVNPGDSLVIVYACEEPRFHKVKE
jgi:hypothetical protein